MPSAFPEDDLLNEFGIEAVYIDPDGEQTDVTIVFASGQNPSEVLDVSVQNRSTYVMAKKTEVPGIDNRASFRIEGVTYRVIRVDDDEHNLALIQLSRDAAE